MEDAYKRFLSRKSEKPGREGFCGSKGGFRRRRSLEEEGGELEDWEASHEQE